MLGRLFFIFMPWVVPNPVSVSPTVLSLSLSLSFAHGQPTTMNHDVTTICSSPLLFVRSVVSSCPISFQWWRFDWRWITIIRPTLLCLLFFGLALPPYFMRLASSTPIWTWPHSQQRNSKPQDSDRQRMPRRYGPMVRRRRTGWHSRRQQYYRGKATGTGQPIQGVQHHSTVHRDNMWQFGHHWRQHSQCQGLFSRRKFFFVCSFVLSLSRSLDLVTTCDLQLWPFLGASFFFCLCHACVFVWSIESLDGSRRESLALLSSNMQDKQTNKDHLVAIWCMVLDTQLCLFFCKIVRWMERHWRSGGL